MSPLASQPLMMAENKPTAAEAAYDRKHAVLDAMTPFDISCTSKGNPFVGDTPQQTMENVCGVLRVLEETAMHEPESGAAKYETRGWYLLFSGLAGALQVHVQHMEHEGESQRTADDEGEKS